MMATTLVPPVHQGQSTTHFCSHPSHAAWWGTNPEQPLTDFYHRSSKCKKCYIRQQQESKTRRITPGSSVSPNSLDSSLSLSNTPNGFQMPFQATTPLSGTRLGPAPSVGPRPPIGGPIGGLNFGGVRAPFGMPTFPSPSPSAPLGPGGMMTGGMIPGGGGLSGVPGGLSGVSGVPGGVPFGHHPHPHPHPHSHSHPSVQSFTPSLPFSGPPNNQIFNQPVAAATTPFILSRPPRELNKSKLSASILSRCKAEVLDPVRAHPDSHHFNVPPVDPMSLGIDEFSSIKKPMDLRTVEDNLTTVKYIAESQFVEDMRLIWENAKTYNKMNTEIYDASLVLSEMFENLYKRVSKECEHHVKSEAEKEVRSDICAFCGFGVVIPNQRAPLPPPPSLQKVQTQTQQITFQPSPSFPSLPPALSSSFPSVQVPSQLPIAVPAPLSSSSSMPSSPPTSLSTSSGVASPPLPSSQSVSSVPTSPPVPSVASPTITQPPPPLASSTEVSTPPAVETKAEENSVSSPLLPSSPTIPSALPTAPSVPSTPVPAASSSSLSTPGPNPSTPLPNSTPRPPLPSSASFPSPSLSKPLPSFPTPGHSPSISALSSIPPLSSIPKPIPLPITTPLLHCDGACLRAFHPHCLALSEYSSPWLCNECRTGKPVLHWDPAKSEYFYYFYDTAQTPPTPEDEEFSDYRSIGTLPREAKRKLREEEEEYRQRGEMYYDDMWCMWRCRSRDIVQHRDERQKNHFKKVAAPER